MKNSLRIHKWTHNEFNIFILGVLTRPPIEGSRSREKAAVFYCPQICISRFFLRILQ